MGKLKFGLWIPTYAWRDAGPVTDDPKQLDLLARHIVPNFA